MITRKLAKLLRGKTTPFQIFTASMLGTALGFLPGFEQAPGLIVALVALLLVLNANLFVAALCAAVGKLAGLALLSPSFAIGRAMIDDLFTESFRTLVNAPVLRFFGFEHYAVSGGLVLGLAIGALLGLLLAVAQIRLRRSLSKLEVGSQRYQQFTSKRWVKLLSFLFVGKRKASWEELATKRVGLPVRPLGVLAVVALGGAAFAAQSFLSSELLAGAVRKGLERANGATVELEGFQLSPQKGSLGIERLAMADRLELDTDLFRGLAFQADVSVKELLRGRVVIDRLAVREAKAGAKRDTPAERVGQQDPLDEAQTDAKVWLPDLEEFDLESVLSDVERWKQTLAKLQRLLERMTGDEQPEITDPSSEDWRERLRQRAAESGLAEVVATHLFAAEPRFLVRELVIEDFRFAQIGEQAFDLAVVNLSSAPADLDAGIQLALKTRDDSIRFDADLGSRSGPGAARESKLAFRAQGLDVDALAAGLLIDGERLVRGGKLSVAMEGGFDARQGTLDLPLRITLDGTELSVPRVGSTQVENFQLPIGVRGPLASPLVSVDDDQLVAALMAAGKQAFADRVRQEADARLAEAKEKLRAELTGRYGDQLAALGIDLDQIDDLDDIDALAREHLGVPLAAISGGQLTEVAEQALQEAAQEVKDQAQEAVKSEASQVLEEALGELGTGKLPDLEQLGEGKLPELEQLGERLGEDTQQKLGDKLGGLFGKPKPKPKQDR